MKRKRNTFAIAAHMRVTRILICLPIGESTRINSACRWYLYFWSESDLNPFLLFSTLLLESEYSIYLRIIYLPRRSWHARFLNFHRQLCPVIPPAIIGQDFLIMQLFIRPPHRHAMLWDDKFWRLLTRQVLAIFKLHTDWIMRRQILKFTVRPTVRRRVALPLGRQS